MSPLRILCYGASNVWGFKPGSYNFNTGLAERYSENERWTGILAKNLSNCVIIEEGLNGRTTAFDDTFAGKPYRNGLAMLPICLESHYPLDLVIFFLGTNDTKHQFNKTAQEIAKGMEQLVMCALQSNKGPGGLSPKVLLIAPQPITKGASQKYFDESSIEKSQAIIGLYRTIALKYGCGFVDSSESVRSSEVDGIHLAPKDHHKLAEQISSKIIGIFHEGNSHV